MVKRTWIGGIYLKEEGGYEIILKSLIHYKKRLQTMFAPILQSKARKKIPIIDEVKEKIDQCLLNLIPVQSLEQNLEILQKALECRKADIEKAENTGAEYFINLLGDVHKARNDLEEIEKALIKINQYSE